MLHTLLHFFLPVPVIRLDGSRCHRECSVGDEGRSLSNQPHPPSPSQTQAFGWRGTSGTVALPGQTCYWQVKLQATPKPVIDEWCYLCEVGVASQEDLQATGVVIGRQGHSVLTATLGTNEGSVWASVWHHGKDLPRIKLAPFKPHKPVERTLGFLLLPPTTRLVVIDVDATRVLCDRQVDMSRPLWPCVSVTTEASYTQASVRLVVDSGPELTLTPAMVSLLRTLLG